MMQYEVGHTIQINKLQVKVVTHQYQYSNQRLVYTVNPLHKHNVPQRDRNAYNKVIPIKGTGDWWLRWHHLWTQVPSAVVRNVR